MRRRNSLWILAALGLCMLILDTPTALRGASEGLMLCIGTVIPSLFPFFILSILLTAALTGRQMPFFTPIGRLCAIPSGAESLFLTGLLGGYPAGAQCVGQAYSQGAISKENARRLLGFCSNAGPSFLFGILGSKFDNPAIPWVLWAIQILSALTVGILLPGRCRETALPIKNRSSSLTTALDQSIRITARVCGWVMLFRVMASILDRWVLWLLPAAGQVTVLGTLELANGCCELEYVGNPALRFIIASGILSFGGLCVMLQTMSVTENLGLGLYIPGKILQSMVALFLSAGVVPLLFPGEGTFSPVFLAGSGLIAAMVLIMLKKRKIYSSNPAILGV